MIKEKPNIELVQLRVANSCIGASTLRNQGAPGIVKKARRFCSELDLMELKNMTDGQFQNWLRTKTEDLMRQFPEQAKDNWGAARKAINVFLEEASYNRFLHKEYELHKLQALLEIPLDNQVVKALKRDARKHGIRYDLLRWKGIRGLTPEQNTRYQELASEMAIRKKTLRVFLDLEYWRRK